MSEKRFLLASPPRWQHAQSALFGGLACIGILKFLYIHELVAVCPKADVPKKPLRLADCASQGWVLNPDGCGFRAGLQRTLADQGLSLNVNLETFGTELQLGLVADGMGLALVPRLLLERSVHRDQLAVLPLKDFKPVMDLWLLYPRFLGNLQVAVNAFGA